MRNEKRKAGGILIVIGIILLIGAAALLFHNKKEDKRAGEESAGILPVLQEEAGIPVPAEIIPEDTEMPVKEVDGQQYIGTIKVPVYGVDLPVNADWDMDKLKTSPCRFNGNYKTDDMVICAHNYVSHFGSLLGIVPGDMVIFTAVDGKEYTYTVSNMETLESSAVKRMIENANNAVMEGVGNEWDLTLFTCTPGGRTRFAIRCTRMTGAGAP